MTGVDGPAGDLITASRRLMRRVRSRDTLAVQAELLAMDRAGLLLPAVRSWLLVLSELGAPRLPGGELVEPGNAGGLIRAEVGPAEAGWQLDLRESLAYAVDRDGDQLFAVIERALRDDDVFGYLSGLVTTVQTVVDALALTREQVHTAHLLGHFTRTPGHWSVAGVGLRLVIAIQSVLDTGPQFADAIIGPEVEAIAKLTGLQQAHLLGVMGPAFGALIGDDDEHVITREGGRRGPYDKHQVRAAELAMQVAKAYRGRLARVVQLADEMDPSDLGLAAYGLGNMLGARSRRLWGQMPTGPT